MILIAWSLPKLITYQFQLSALIEISAFKKDLQAKVRTLELIANLPPTTMETLLFALHQDLFSLWEPPHAVSLEVPE